MHRRLAGSGLRQRVHAFWQSFLGIGTGKSRFSTILARKSRRCSTTVRFRSKTMSICAAVACDLPHYSAEVTRVQVVRAVAHGLKTGPDIAAFYTVHSYATRLFCPPVAGSSKGAKRKCTFSKCSMIINKLAGDTLFDINASTDSSAL